MPVSVHHIGHDGQHGAALQLHGQRVGAADVHHAAAAAYGHRIKVGRMIVSRLIQFHYGLADADVLAALLHHLAVEAVVGTVALAVVDGESADGLRHQFAGVGRAHHQLVHRHGAGPQLHMQFLRVVAERYALTGITDQREGEGSRLRPHLQCETALLVGDRAHRVRCHTDVRQRLVSVLVSDDTAQRNIFLRGKRRTQHHHEQDE